MAINACGAIGGECAVASGEQGLEIFVAWSPPKHWVYYLLIAKAGYKNFPIARPPSFGITQDRP